MVALCLPSLAQSDREFTVASAALVGSTVFDVESTFRGMGRNPNLIEGNKLMRPFVNAGRPATYGVTMGIDAGLLWWSHREKRRGSKFWWVPIAVGTGVHIAAGVNNLRLARR